jgi:Ca2+/H+ antiporter
LCDHERVANCGRCALPLCAEHTPPADERCERCEEEYRPAPDRSLHTDWRIVGTTIGLTVVVSIILLCLYAAGTVPAKALLFLAIAPICAYPLGLMMQAIIHGAHANTKNARARERFMSEQRMRRTEEGQS